MRSHWNEKLSVWGQHCLYGFFVPTKTGLHLLERMPFFATLDGETGAAQTEHCRSVPGVAE